jgi:mono/diheme cytochrome c family protein
VQLSHIIYFTFLISFVSCGPAYKNEAFKRLSTEDQNKFQKYLIQGRDLYQNNCTSCHQKDGRGLKKLIPPLANADFLRANQVESARLIRNGAKIPIVVNGISYPPTMPSHPHLSNLEIAEVLTYINNSWGNEFGFIDGRKVGEFLK